MIGVESIPYMPHYEDREGEYRGLGREILDAFARDAGLSVEYRPMPVSRLFLEFVNGGVDLKYPDSPLWQLEQKSGSRVTYSAPVVPYVDGVMVLPSRAGLGAGSIRTLGTVRGFTAWEWQDRVPSGTVRIEENNSLQGLLQQAIRGRVDGAYANIDVVAHLLRTTLRTPGALVFDPTLPHIRGHYHLSSIKRPDAIARFDAWMRANRDTLAALQQRYGLPPSS